MEIKKIVDHKEDFMDLLLLADEQENMVNKYLYRGDLFALYDDYDHKIVEDGKQLIDMIYLKIEF